jgi:hypothetical protein
VACPSPAGRSHHEPSIPQTWPQVHASKDAEQEGEVAYPSPAKPPLPGSAAGGRRGGGDGQLRAPDLPSAPPLPSESAQAEARRLDLEPALHA